MLLKSRRRCCLCFWLNGIDDVVKGQIAHLDQDSSNSSFENLAFLCFEHHDEYDSRPNVSKGLQQPEVTQWRDELYKEMEYRFRSVRERKVEVSIVRFEPVEHRKTFRLVFRLKNVGQATIVNATLSIRLPQNVTANSPRKQTRRKSSDSFINMGLDLSGFEMQEIFGFHECTEDFFEPGGRVATYDMHAINQGLLPDHSLEITGLGFRSDEFQDGTDLCLEYRVDANDMDPQRGTVSRQIPTGLEWVLQDPEKYGLPRNITLEELEAKIDESADDQPRPNIEEDF
ncbi:hypothetical protein KOR42_54970 [Thalassoglobus neptunius]|uniref:HNH nuclease domain-containing protein n=1 Tax=Thalassoglobus neptunius TaxID=1938619 RepID=A0A5C5UVE8_9PLAN|nr:hypothetical protein KOR42_54970 [Thalassoglobus neptunius]